METLDKKVIQQAIAAALVSEAKESISILCTTNEGCRLAIEWALRCAEDARYLQRERCSGHALNVVRRWLDQKAVAIELAAVTNASKTSYDDSYSSVADCAAAYTAYAANAVDRRAAAFSDTSKDAYTDNAVCAVDYAVGCAAYALHKRTKTPVEETKEKQREYLLALLQRRFDS